MADEKKHVLIPEHLKLSDKEKTELFEKHSIKFIELPKMYLYDPAIEHLGVKEGDVIKIIRKSQTAGKTVFYRGVINE
jgi:DNA-directed RNA polymerase subunit H (RpoH/RPB5)